MVFRKSVSIDDEEECVEKKKPPKGKKISNNPKNLLLAAKQVLLQRARMFRDEQSRLFYFDGKIFTIVDNTSASGFLWDEFVKINLPEDVYSNITSPSFYRKLSRDLSSTPQIERIDIEECLAQTKYLIAFKNGIYDAWQDVFIRDFSPDYKIITMLDADFVQHSAIELFSMFLYEITGGDEDTITLIWQIIAYAVLPNNDAKRFFVLGTEKNSGKSVLLRLLQSFFRRFEINRQALHEFKGRFGFASLSGKRINVGGECVEGKIKNEVVANIKLMTGERELNIEKKGIDSSMEKTNCKLFFATNSPISIERMDEAFFDRMLIIPFQRSFDRSEQDPELTEKLIRIKDDIVSYAVRNYAYELVTSNYCFCEPEAAKEMKTSWINNHRSSLDLFVEEYLTVTNQSFDFISNDELYEVYRNWMDENFPNEYRREKRGLTRDLRAKYIQCDQIPEKGKVDGKFVRVIRGIRLQR